MRPTSIRWGLSNLISTRKLACTLTLYWKEWEENNRKCLYRRNKECRTIVTTQNFLFIQDQSRAVWFLSYYVKLRKTTNTFFRAGQTTDDNMAHEVYKLGTKNYKRTLRICNNSCFSTATVVARTRLNVTLYIYCLSCLVVRLLHSIHIRHPVCSYI